MREIEALEQVIKIRFTESERSIAEARLETLKNSFDLLGAADTEGIEPLVATLGVTNAFREDIALKAFTREEVLLNAPEQYGGYFQTPRTVAGK